MFTRCIFCHDPFPGPLADGIPPGERFAFDPGRGRLWVICGRCRRWNLLPLEDRLEAIQRLERLARDDGHLVASTSNISLLEAGRTSLIRVGTAGLGEQAWWRYGRQLKRRHQASRSARSRVAAAAYNTLAFLGDISGLVDMGLGISWDETPVADVLRWRHFGWAAWAGRSRCPYCGSVLRALPFELSWWVYPRMDEDGNVYVGVPCSRCDPWTPEKVFSLQGTQAVNVLRRLLAYQHVMGAPERTVEDAVHLIETAGSASEYSRLAAQSGYTLWRMGPLRSIALEIALNESVEHRIGQLEARAVASIWKVEEELARIIDEELSTTTALERHLRKLQTPVLQVEAGPLP